MASKHTIGNEVSDDAQTNEEDAGGNVVIEEPPELRPSVEQEIQARVDTNHPDATPGGLTLAAEERLAAREWELERTRVRFDRRASSDREARSRRVAERVSSERRHEIEARAASVDPWADPDGDDPRVRLAREELAAVNREAARLAERLAGWTRAAISRRLAERVVEGAGVMGAVVGVYEELQQAPGQVIPIAAVGEVRRREVSVEGRVKTLWAASSSVIQQVGLIEDETGTTKFTVWSKSRQPVVEEGERVVFRNVATSWYQGRVSVAVTGRSRLSFPERERWWVE